MGCLWPAVSTQGLGQTKPNVWRNRAATRCSAGRWVWAERRTVTAALWEVCKGKYSWEMCFGILIVKKLTELQRNSCGKSRIMEQWQQNDEGTTTVHYVTYACQYVLWTIWLTIFLFYIYLPVFLTLHMNANFIILDMTANLPYFTYDSQSSFVYI